jgi:hypothetical protein
MHQVNGELIKAMTNETINNHLSSHSIMTDDLRNVLLYILPVSCLMLIIFLVIAVGLRQRHRVFDKWSSLKRMRNTDPKFFQRPGLHRDSEYDFYDDKKTHTIYIALRDQVEYRLETIT